MTFYCPGCHLRRSLWLIRRLLLPGDNDNDDGQAKPSRIGISSILSNVRQDEKRRKLERGFCQDLNNKRMV